MTREDAIKVLRTESVEIGGNAVSVCRFWVALDMAIAALMEQEGKDTNAPTNADRIRAMSDEELAGFLMKLMHNNVQCFGEGMFPYHPCPQEQNCKQCGLDWLQQPAEEDDHA